MSDENILDIRERLVKIETLLEGKMDNLEEKIKVANHRISDLEDTIKWLWRAVAGGIVAGAIALLFK